MKHFVYVSGLLTLVLLCIKSFAERYETKGTLLNQECRPIGIGCGRQKQMPELHITYIYNEPHYGSFAIQCLTSEIKNHALLAKKLYQADQFTLETVMQIPDDVKKALHLPEHFQIESGTYPVHTTENYIQIQFID